MILLKKIVFNKDIVFESNREDHKNNFKVKTRRYTMINHRKSTRDPVTHKRIVAKEKVIEKSFVIFENKLQVEFHNDITILVGENGCGKSSFVKQIYIPEYQRPIWSDKSEEDNVREFFSEYLKNDERTLTFSKVPGFFINGKNIHKNVFIDNIKNSKITLDPIDILNMWDMYDSSNGENTLDFINSIKDIKNTLIILDEPETSLSVKSQIKVSKILQKLSKENQLIVITHSPIIMGITKDVYNLESKKYEDTQTYVDSLYN